MPLLETKGAGSAQGYGEFTASAPKVYIEDVFSTWLYAGTGSAQTITNGIDLSGKGGLVWTKSRTEAGRSHALFDTARGINAFISSNLTSNFTVSPSGDAIASFNSTGYVLGADTGNWGVNNTGQGNLVSWTFRKQPKFFDVVTYTGDGNYSTDTPSPYGRAISHSLSSTPGFIVIKATSTTGQWYVAARQDATYWRGSLGAGTSAFALNRTNSGILYDWATKPMGDATSFFPAQIGAGGSSGTTNDNGVTYVAYLFAHDAGGFGLSGTDNVISCGSFTTDGSGNATVSLGYEPQWVLIKYNSNDSWRLFDNMRGMSQTNWVELYPNTSDAEVNRTNQTDLFVRPNATGFTTTWSPQASRDAIYIAIRRGPMKVPTSGTSVFSPESRTGGGSSTYTATGVTPTDLFYTKRTNGAGSSAPGYFWSRLQGNNGMTPTGTAAESSTFAVLGFDAPNNNGVRVGNTNNYWDTTSEPYVNYLFRRAPGFFDVVCYTGNGSTQTVAHNLGAIPELIIFKARSTTASWWTYVGSLGYTKSLRVNVDSAESTGETRFGTTNPTASNFYVDAVSAGGTNSNSITFVAYLFATVAGVSKVGSYTGTGTTKQIDCGFTGGARFILIKRTDSTGDWYVYDTARGIVAGNDSYLVLNSTAAEVTNTDWVDTYSAGFELSSAAGNNVNINNAAYIFLSVA